MEFYIKFIDQKEARYFSVGNSMDVSLLQANLD